MEKLSKQCYAYPEKELYPVHTKEAALQSWQEFKQDLDNYTDNELEYITGRFIKSAKANDFSYPTWEEQEAAPEVTVIEDQQGNSASFSKIASLQDVQTVVDTLQASRETLKGPFMRKVALALYSQADDLALQGVCMKKLARFAGLGVGDPQEAVIEFRKRGGLIDLPQDVTAKFYEQYREFESMQDKDSLVKVANQMCDLFSQLDGIFKLQSYYGNEIQAPEDIFFKDGLDEIAENLDDYLRVPSTDTILSKKALLESKEAVKEFLSSKYGEKAESDEEVLNKVASLSAEGIKALIQVLD